MAGSSRHRKCTRWPVTEGVCAKKPDFSFSLSLLLTVRRLRFPSCATYPATTRRKQELRGQYMEDIYYCKGGNKPGKEKQSTTWARRLPWPFLQADPCPCCRGLCVVKKRNESRLVLTVWSRRFSRLESGTGSSRTIVCARRGNGNAVGEPGCARRRNLGGRRVTTHIG
jgi:hypothetical protein